MSNDIPQINLDELNKKVEEDPKSKKWNNANSRQNLRQYKKKKAEPTPESPVIAEAIVIDREDRDSDLNASEIVRGRKINVEMVKKLLPGKGILKPGEKVFYTDLITNFLSDFKDEEPTASDIDDLMELGLCKVRKHRLLKVAQSDDSVLLEISNAMDKIDKREKELKESLASRRVDRVDVKGKGSFSFIDYVAAFDKKQSDMRRKRVEEITKAGKEAEKKIKDYMKREG